MRNLTLSTLGLLLVAGSLACGDAKAMAKRPTPQTEPVPVPTVVVTSERYQQGLALGERNGTLLAERLRERTVGLSGCSAIDDLQRGLLAVSRTVRPPVTEPLEPRESSELARGYFRGYTDAIRKAIHETRDTCSFLAYDSGDFAGELYGSLLCQVTKVDVSILSELELVPLYQGWTGGVSQVISQCHEKASITIERCGTDISSLQSQLELLVQTSCHD